MANNSGVSKPFYKRWWFILICVLVGIGIIGNLAGKGKDDPAETTIEATTKQSTMVTTTTRQTTPVTTTTTKQTSEENSALEQAMLLVMEDNFGKGYVTLDSELKVFSVVPKDGATFMAGVIAAQEGSEEDVAAWNYVVESMTTLSESIRDNVGAGYTLSVTNPMNEENTLLMVMDGVIFYNAVEGAE